ncbi:MAG: S9 family peptidase, partial [Steroidobacteraceae bacterium]
MACLASVSVVSVAADSTNAADVFHYPAARRGSTVDVLHGREVADPYRWMETPSAELTAWVAAENAIADPFLAAIPAREAIKKRLTELWDYEQYGYGWLSEKSQVPVKLGGRYFYVEKSGSQNQGILYWAESLNATPKVLVDPNVLSADATASLADYSISPDGRYLAYAVSDGGTDWDTWHVREVETGRDLPDLIGDTKFTGVSWLPDSSAFYYSRYPKGADGKADDQQQVSVYRHALKEAQSDDALVYQTPENPRHNPYATVSEDGRWLVYGVFYGFDSNA